MGTRAGCGVHHTLCDRRHREAGGATHIQVVDQGLAGHLPRLGVLAADGMLVCPQKVVQQPLLLQGLPDGLAFVQRDPAEAGGSAGRVASAQGCPASARGPEAQGSVSHSPTDFS